MSTLFVSCAHSDTSTVPALPPSSRILGNWARYSPCRVLVLLARPPVGGVARLADARASCIANLVDILLCRRASDASLGPKATDAHDCVCPCTGEQRLPSWSLSGAHHDMRRLRVRAGPGGDWADHGSTECSGFCVDFSYVRNVSSPINCLVDICRHGT
jgi:hypothetical protein